MIRLNLYTIGHQYYQDYKFPVSISREFRSLLDTEARRYYKIVFLNSNSTQILLNNQKLLLLGSHILYLNERDTCEVIGEEDSDSYILFFQPTVFNPKLQFEICNSDEELSVTDHQDMYYFMRFRWDTSNEDKVFSVSENSATIIHKKLQEIEKLLSDQYTLYWPCMTRTLTLEILFHMAQVDHKGVNLVYLNDNCYSLVTQVIAYFQMNYADKITINSICTLFGTNRTSLQSEFKKMVNKSPIQYLTQIRMKIATTLLKDTLIPISDICDRVGFNDMSYFIRVFKKELAITPAEYRKEYNHID